MKKLFMTMIAVFFTAMCMTGCLGDDTSSTTYHNVTSTERTKIMQNIAGDFSGKVSWVSSAAVKDSADAEWTINSDTTVTFKYPVSLLAAYVDTTTTTEVYKALKSAPEQTLKMKFTIPSVLYTTIWENYWYLGDYIPILYTQEEEKTFTNNGYTFILSYDNYYDIITYGYYNFEYYNNQSQGYIRPISIKATSSAGESSTIKINVPTVFYGKK